MMVHGAWTYGNMKADGGNFVTGGHLGYMNFPPVDGGKGDPSDHGRQPGSVPVDLLEGHPGRARTSRRSSCPARRLDDADGQGVDQVRQRPGGEERRGQARLGHRQDDAEWLKFVYDTSANAKTFAQSWDQALSPTAAEALLDNIAKLFQLSISPQQFAGNMNEVIGK